MSLTNITNQQNSTAVAIATGATRHLAKDCMYRVFSFLEPMQLTTIQRVSHAWQNMINSEDERAWKDQCLTQKSINPINLNNALVKAFESYSAREKENLNEYESLNSSLLNMIASYVVADRVLTIDPTIKKALIDYQPKDLEDCCDSIATSFTPYALSIITSYLNARTYKEFALPLRGGIYLQKHVQYLYGRDLSKHAGVSCEVASDESEIACEILHQRPRKDREIISHYCVGFHAGSWFDSHPRISGFSNNLPLSWFMNPDGSFKPQNSQIQLRLGNGLDAILTIMDTTPSIDISRRIKFSLDRDNLTKEVLRLEQAAATVAGKWIAYDHERPLKRAGAVVEE